MPADTPSVRTGALDVGDATIHFEVRGDGDPLVLHAAPMGAASFEPLADLLADRFTVVTSDPRGINRSTVADRRAVSTPGDRARDLAALIDHVALGPAVVFGSSGGAVSALALAQQHPARVETVIAHEPPLIEVLDDRDQLCAAEHQLVDIYRREGRAAYWHRFLEVAGIELPPGVFEMMFGSEPTEQELRDERFGVERMLVATTTWQPEIAALIDSPVRIVPMVGEESTGQLCDRTTRALARELDVDVLTMPGDHTGFASDPKAFAPLLAAAATRAS